MMPTQQLLASVGYPADCLCKVLPDGRIAWIHQLMFTHAVLVSRPEQITRCYEDRWCFITKAEAVRALDDWTTQQEPAGWIRHPNTGRRRPYGDASKEYVEA
jgi:hypothetical protein